MTRTVLRVITRLNRGGPLRQLEALVPGLRELGWAGPVATGTVEKHERDGRPDLLAHDVDVRDVPGLQRGIHPGADRLALRALCSMIESVAPDIVHSHMGKAGALARLAGKRLGVPVVHTLHGHHFARGGMLGRLARFAERRLARHTSGWITLSPSQRDDLLAVVGRRAAPRVHVVAPGFDVASFGPKVPCPPPPPRLLWSGRHVPVKNVGYLIEAFEQMRVPATLTLLGGGPGLEAARERIAASPRCEDVHLHEEVDDPRSLIASHHVVVLSSISEGTPLSLLEGMAAGRAVVSTSVGGVRDIVTHEQTGLLVPADRPPAGFARALDRVAGDPALRERLGARACADVAQRFGRDRLARDTVRVYEAVLCAAKA